MKRILSGLLLVYGCSIAHTVQAKTFLETFVPAWKWGLSSNYVLQGESRSGNDPSLQSSVVLMQDTSGLYASFDANSVAKVDSEGKIAPLELKPGIGWFYRNPDGYFDSDIQANFWLYPGSKGLEYPQISWSPRFYIARGEVGYAQDVFSSGRHGFYVQIGSELDLKHIHDLVEGIVLSGYTGHYKLPEVEGGSYDYLHFQVERNIGGYSIAMHFKNTWNNQRTDMSLHNEKYYFTFNKYF